MNTTAPRGYIALISVIIISLILLALTMTVSAQGYFTRFNGLDREYKRVSLGIAESCVNAALLKVGQTPVYQLTSDPAYDATVSAVRVPVGSSYCLIKDVSYESPVNNRKRVNISTTGEYKGTFSTINTTATVQDGNVASPAQATLTIVVTMVNDNAGTKQSGDVTLSVSGTNPSATSVQGASSGTVVYLDQGTFIVTAPTFADYQGPFDSGCAGSAQPAEHYTCTISYNDVPTTASLTLSPIVTNDDNGTKSPSDFALFINGTRVQAGVPVANLTPGVYTATFTVDSEYNASAWGYNCATNGTINLQAGDNKTCKIHFNDVTPPSPACADVVMMLDRTGSIFSNNTDPINEAIAAKSLLNLYGGLGESADKPRVGIGGFGARYYPAGAHHTVQNAAQIPDGSAEQPVSGLLTDDFGHDDLAREVSSIPATSSTNLPSEWATPDNAFLDDGIYATTNSNGAKQGYGNFGFSLPQSATVKGIEVRVKAKASPQTQSGTLGVRLWWESGGIVTLPKNAHYDATESEKVFGGPTDTFGRTWTASDFANGAFAVRLENNYSNGFLLSVNSVSVKVYYTEPGTRLFSTVDALMDLDPDLNHSATNLSSAISVSANELNSDRHRANSPKVLILVSDGMANVPTPESVAREAARNAAAAAKADGVAIYGIHFGDTSGRSFLAELSTTSTNEAGGSMLQSRIDAENNDNDYFYISPTSEAMRGIFEAIGRRACPALDPTVTPPATHARLIIITHVINDNGGLRQAQDFTMTVSANNASHSSFSGVASPGKEVTVDAGAYSVDEGNVGQYAKTVGPECSSVVVGPIASGETRVCTIVNDDLPSGTPPPPPLPPLPPQISINSWQERP